MGARALGPAGHRRRCRWPPVVCTGWAEHHRRCDALTQLARVYGPPAAGAPPQHPDVARVAPPARGLLSSHWGRFAAAKLHGPRASSASTRAGRDAVAAPHPDPVSAAPCPPVRGRLGPNYDARSVIRSQQLACHGADVDQAAVGMVRGHQPEKEQEQASSRCGGRPYDRDGDRSSSPGLWAFRRRIQKVPFPLQF
jgi:hypothetical protein